MLLCIGVQRRSRCTAQVQGVAEIRDANDNLAPFVVAPVTLAIETNPRGDSLSGATTLNTTAGVATFNGLSIDKPVTDYTLTALSGTLASATSETFSITQRMCSLVPIPRPLPGAFSSEVGVADYYAIDEIRVSDLLHTDIIFGGFVIADCNNDGLDDVITSGPTGVEGTPIRIVANDGTGSFVAATSTIIEGAVPAPVHARQAIAADFDGDGWTDVFFANHGYDMSPGPGELNTLLLSNGAGKLVDSPGNIHNVVGFTHSAAAGDVDCDGDKVGHVGDGSSHNMAIPTARAHEDRLASCQSLRVLLVLGGGVGSSATLEGRPCKGERSEPGGVGSAAALSTTSAVYRRDFA